MKVTDTEQLAQQIRQALDKQASGLDAQTRSRLHAARQQALARAGSKKRFFRWPIISGADSFSWMPAGAMASLLLVSLIMLSLQHSGQQSIAPLGSELDTLLVSEELELYEQLDFYLWLDQEPAVMRLPDHKT